MTPATRKTIAFIAGTGIGIGVWSQRPVDKPVVVDSQTTDNIVPQKTVSWDSARIRQALDAVNDAPTAAARLTAATRLEEIPFDHIPEALEIITGGEDWNLSLQAKLLLVRWGEKDGEAAMHWVWSRFVSDNVWSMAFREIGPAWEWRDSLGFGKWLVEKIPMTPRPDAGGKELLGGEPSLSPTLVGRAASWLVRDQPKLAYQAAIKSRNQDRYGAGLETKIETTAQIREALSVFDPLPVLDSLPRKSATFDPFDNNSAEFERQLVLGLFRRWQQIDPDDFKRSGFAASIPDPVTEGQSQVPLPVNELPPEQRAGETVRLISSANPGLQYHMALYALGSWMKADPSQCFEWIETASAAQGGVSGHELIVAAFDVWDQQHPGETPDQTGWSPDRIRQWQDLATLRRLAISSP